MHSAFDNNQNIFFNKIKKLFLNLPHLKIYILIIIKNAVHIITSGSSPGHIGKTLRYIYILI